MSDKFKFFYPLKVRFAETDAQGHVFFGNYYTYFDEGLVEYLRELGYSYQDLLQQGMDFLYVESGCRHYSSARFDDVLHVHTTLGKIGNSSLTFEFSIYQQDSDELVATGHIVAVNIDLDTNRPVPVPDALRDAVASYES
ncbi:MAG: acyl-CoA thioesterase [Anaerolineae bacterium]|nr:acyl-CoA thioesterase [Anaerolineae bacterium]